jgi:hypothetical protein
MPQNQPSRMVVFVSLLLFILVVVGPVGFYRFNYVDISSSVSHEAAATTVAVGAIFRSNSRNFLKSTFMSAVRTALRTWIRRLVRLAIPILLRVFLPLLKTKKKRSTEEIRQPVWMALLLGFTALWISFYGVVSFHSDIDEQVLFGFSLGVSATLAASTYLLHALLLWFFAQRNGTVLSINTSLEGILLQGYFTGALSYLPLASDLSIKGTVEDRAKTHLSTLLSLLGGSVILHFCGDLFSIPLVSCWSTHMLLYCFVISFPLKPLDGSGLFAYSKRLWFLVFSLVMLCFLFNMPEYFYGIL